MFPKEIAASIEKESQNWATNPEGLRINMETYNNLIKDK